MCVALIQSSPRRRITNRKHELVFRRSSAKAELTMFLQSITKLVFVDRDLRHRQYLRPLQETIR
jgi:hypothetical protein